MNSILGWELKEEGDLINLSRDGEGTYEVGTQLPAGQAETQIPGRKPDLISSSYNPDLVVTLRRGKLPGVVGARVETRKLPVELGQHCFHASGGGVHFHNGRVLGIRMGEDGNSAEGLLELLEGRSSFGVPRQRLGFLWSMDGRGLREDRNLG